LPVVPLDVPGGHAKGRPDAPVTIVEFSDFECGHCKLAYEGLKQALPIYGDQVQVRFHHYPLDGSCNPAMPAGGGHKYACLAAMAAECADAQGKFWQYHDTLFEHQPAFTREDLLRYAADVGLDRDAFVACLDTTRRAPRFARTSRRARSSASIRRRRSTSTVAPCASRCAAIRSATRSCSSAPPGRSEG
jgi:protein-disulfide isomerase